jgi:hypothetical protein
LTEILAQDKIYFDRHFALLTYFTYHLEPVLAPNYKQHNLFSVEVRNLRYSLSELFESVYLNLFKWGRREVHETFKGVSANYKILGTSGIYLGKSQ